MRDGSESKSPADTKASEEGGGGGAPSTRAEPPEAPRCSRWTCLKGATARGEPRLESAACGEEAMQEQVFRDPSFQERSSPEGW